MEKLISNLKRKRTQITPPVPASRTTVPRVSSNSSDTSSTSKQQASRISITKPRTKAADTPSRLLPKLDLESCSICGRQFNADRIGKHQTICQRVTTSKRKVFDATKQRVKGTDAEKYVTRKSKSISKAPPAKVAPQSNWRKKHEDFINSIRAAKEVQVHLSKGGKLSDLPPPPPSDYSDYVQCPHCSRRFNQTAADRHIPKCATFAFNKPNQQKKSTSTPGSKATRK